MYRTRLLQITNEHVSSTSLKEQALELSVQIALDLNGKMYISMHMLLLRNKQV